MGLKYLNCKTSIFHAPFLVNILLHLKYKSCHTLTQGPPKRLNRLQLHHATTIAGHLVARIATRLHLLHRQVGQAHLKGAEVQKKPDCSASSLQRPVALSNAASSPSPQLPRPRPTLQRSLSHASDRVNLHFHVLVLWSLAPNMLHTLHQQHSI